MPNSFQEISKYTANSGGKTDANLANDSNHLGGIAAEEYATKSWVQQYHERLELALRNYINTQDASILEQAKRYADAAISSQDFSQFAKISDLQTLNQNLTAKINKVEADQKAYTDSKIKQVVTDSNANFTDIENAINNTNKNVSNLSSSLNSSVSNINKSINELSSDLDNSVNNINSSISEINSDIDELFQSVSNGKGLIAEAITDKGVPTSANAAFSTMANNIRAIETGGGIPEGYVDTSDATATANDILKGKTAYVNGQKLYGNFVYSGNSENQYDPGYATTAQVELVYEELEDTLQVSVGFNTKISGYGGLFAVTGDGKVLVIYNTENKQLETYYRRSSGFGKVENQYGEVKTPNFKLSDLGISDDILNNYTVRQISCSKMDSYSCKLAILMTQNAANNTNGAVRIYVFTLTTSLNGGSSIRIEENETYTAGIEGSTTQETKYKKWLIVYEQLDISATNLSNCKLTWSPFSSKLAVSGKTYGNGNFETRIFDFSEYFEDIKGNTGYGYYSQEDSIYNANKVTFLNEDRLVYCQKQNNSYGHGFLVIYTENFIRVDDVEMPSDFTAYKQSLITPNALYIVQPTKICKLVIDYMNATVNIGDTIWEAESSDEYLDIASIDGYDCCFSYGGKYLFTAYQELKCYQIEYEDNPDVVVAYSQQSPSSSVIPLPGNTGIVFRSAQTGSNYTYSLIEVESNTQKLIGLKYQGNMYYKDFSSAGKLTALATEVKAGRTFVGNMGVVETGTLNV